MATPSPSSRPLRRRRSFWVLIGIAILALALVAVVLGSRMLAQQRDESAADAFSADPSVSAVAGGIEGSWQVADGSEAGYRVEEVLNGEDVTVVGRTTDTTGEVTIEGTELTAGTVTVDLTTVETDESARDEYFRSDAVDTETYPEASFTVDEPVDLAAIAESGSATVTVPGTMEMNGESVEMDVEMTFTRTEDGLTAIGASDMSWADVGVEAPDLGFVTVEDAGQIEFSLVLAQA